MYRLLALLLLASCTSAPNYTPFTENTYEDWRQCRVAYEHEHPLKMKSPVFFVPKEDNLEADFATIMWGPAAGASMNQSGPVFDKAIDSCMNAKGYRKS